MYQLKQLFNAFLGISAAQRPAHPYRRAPGLTDWSRFDCPAYLRRQALSGPVHRSTANER